MLSHRLFRNGSALRAFRTSRSYKGKNTNRQPYERPMSNKIMLGGLGTAAAGGLAYSLFYASNPDENSHIKTTAFWPNYVKERINGTFGYCLGGLAVTTAAATATLQSPALLAMVASNSMMSFFGCIALMMGSGHLCQALKFDGKPFGAKALSYYAHMAIVGAVIAPIAAMGGAVCVRAAAATAAVMAGLATTAMVAPSDAYLKTYGAVNVGCWLMLAACAISAFSAPMGAMALNLETFIILGGLGLFSLKGFTDIQHTVAAASQPGNFDPVNHSLHITMDAINIFIRLAMLMSNGKKKK